MKLFTRFLTFFLTLAFNAETRASACNDYNTNTKIARDAVKALVSLADVPEVVAYYGSLNRDDGTFSIVNVQPHFNDSMDWYHVTIRNSDCRVINAELVGEALPIEKEF